MESLQHADRGTFGRVGLRIGIGITTALLLMAGSAAAAGPVAQERNQTGPQLRQSSEPWQGPILRQPRAEARLVQAMNDVRFELYGLAPMAARPFDGADVTYIDCLVRSNTAAKRLEHFPAECERNVDNGAPEILAWNWNSLGGTTNELADAWNKSPGHRALLVGSADQVSVGVYCIGTTAFGVAWLRRADRVSAQPATLARRDPPLPYKDFFNADRYPMFGDDNFVCQADGSLTAADRPHSDSKPAPLAAPPATIDALIDQRPIFGPDHADVLRLYQAYFGRQPDVGGADYWLDLYDQGISLSRIAEAMAGSEEYSRTFGSMNDEQYIRAVYANALNRAPDGDGFAYWLDLVNRGELSRVEALFYVAFGTEFRSAYPFGGL